MPSEPSCARFAAAISSAGVRDSSRSATSTRGGCFATSWASGEPRCAPLWSWPSAGSSTWTDEDPCLHVARARASLSDCPDPRRAGAARARDRGPHARLAGRPDGRARVRCGADRAGDRGDRARRLPRPHATRQAEARDGPWAQWFPFPLPLPSRDAPPFGPGFKPAAGLPGRLRDRLLGPILLRTYESAAVPPLNEMRRAVGVRPLAGAHEVFTAAPLLL